MALWMDDAAVSGAISMTIHHKFLLSILILMILGCLRNTDNDEDNDEHFLLYFLYSRSRQQHLENKVTFIVPVMHGDFHIPLLQQTDNLY